MYARLRHDNPPRPMTPVLVPETVTLADIAGSTAKGHQIPVLTAWQTWLQKLNTADAYRWLMKPYTMWINGYYDPDKTKAESISCGGGVVDIDRVEKNFGHIRSFDCYETPPYDPSWFNYSSYPQFIQKVTCITRDGAIVKPAGGLDVYFALLRYSDLWVDLKKVELFPELPMEVTVTASKGLWIRSSAGTDKEIISALAYGTKAQVEYYRPLGGSVWGFIGLGWICLSLVGWEYTTWHMDIQPPV